MRTYNHASSEIRIHDPSVRAVQDSGALDRATSGNGGELKVPWESMTGKMVGYNERPERKCWNMWKRNRRKDTKIQTKDISTPEFTTISFSGRTLPHGFCQSVSHISTSIHNYGRLYTKLSMRPQ